MLTLRREALGLTQSELAKRWGVTQGLVSRIEAEVLDFPMSRIEQLAGILQVPTEFLFEAAQVHGYGSPCNYHRKRQDIPVRTLRAIQARVNILRIQVSKLLTGVEVSSAQRFARLDLEEYGTPEEIARLIRASWGLPMGPIVNLVGTIESMGGIVLLTDFRTPRLDAVSQWTGGLPPIFVANETQPGDRLRFTIAHELGHLVMHQNPTPNLEQEADRFASEFLMPAREIRTELSPFNLPRLALLKARWKVSIAALIRRARDLKVLPESQYTSWFKRYNQLGFRRGEPQPIPREQPTVVRDMVRVQMDEHGYTVEELARLALVGKTEFTEQFLPEVRQGLRIVRT